MYDRKLIFEDHLLYILRICNCFRLTKYVFTFLSVRIIRSFISKIYKLSEILNSFVSMLFCEFHSSHFILIKKKLHFAFFKATSSRVLFKTSL